MRLIFSSPRFRVLIKKSDENQSDVSLRENRESIQINEISCSEPEISIANIESSSPSVYERKRHTINNSYNFRLKQKLRFVKTREQFRTAYQKF